MAADLCVVIPSRRRVDLLRACLASIRRHAPAGVEVVVVDDGSDQGVVAAAVAGFAEVRCVRLPRPRGFAAAANLGLASTTRPFAQLLNDDTEVTAGWAESALAAFADPRVAAVAPLVLRWPGGVVDSAGDCYFRGGVAAKRYHGQPVEAVPLDRCRVFGASGSSAFFRREVALRVGGFPETFGAYFEDVDLAFRLNRAGYAAVFEPASRVLHHVNSSYGRPARSLLAQQSRNEERVFWRNLPADVLTRALPAHLVVLAGKAWRRWREGTLRPFLCGRLRVLGEVPALLRHRRQLAALGSAADLTKWPVDFSWPVTLLRARSALLS